MEEKAHICENTKKEEISVTKEQDLTEAEEVRKRWQEYTKEQCQKSLNNPDNHNGVVTHLEPDILECEVK